MKSMQETLFQYINPNYWIDIPRGIEVKLVEAADDSNDLDAFDNDITNIYRNIYCLIHSG